LYSDSDGLTLTEAAIELGVSRNLLKKRCDRKTLSYYLDSSGARRVPYFVIEEMGRRRIESFEVNPHDLDPKFDIPKAELWGNGKAPVVDHATSNQWETVFGVNDIHVPYHDEELLHAVAELAAYVDPDRFVINGDTNDFFGISRYNRANERLDLLQTELDQGKQIRKVFRNAVPNATMEETLGNHEERLLTYPGFNAPALRSLNSLKPNVLLGLDELEIRHWPTNGFRLREDFLVEHGATIRAQSGATAKARLDATLISGVMGHTHRFGEFRRSGYRELAWFETGCLCKLNPDYVQTEANWKQGVWVGLFSTKTENWNVQLIPAVGRGFIYDGRHFGDTAAEHDIFVGPLPNFESEIPSLEKKAVLV
jgi:hypothetical protein